MPAILFIMSFLSYLLCGYLGSIMWRWFAVGIFHLQPLTVAQTDAVLFLLGFFMPTVHPMNDEDKDDIQKIAHGLVYAFVYPLCLFGYAWVLKVAFL